MIIGTQDIKTCNDCPAYKWGGESCRTGDAGCYCGFGVFHSADTYTPKQVPPSCPIRIYRDKIRELGGSV